MAALGRSPLANVQRQIEREWLGKLNIVGVSDGFRTKNGVLTSEPCVVVYVARKIPKDELDPEDVLPYEMDGVPIDVVESGIVNPLI